MKDCTLELWDIQRDGDAKNLEQVITKMANLRGTKAEMTPAMRAFIQEFNDYVDNNKQDIEDPVFLGSWETFTQDYQNYTKAVLIIDLPYENWQKIFIKAVDIAQKYGLGLFFNELLIAFVAKGVICPKDKKRFWTGFKNYYLQDNPVFARTVSEFKKLTHPIIEAILLKNNFTFLPNEFHDEPPFYKRNIDNGFQMLCFGYGCRNGEFCISISLEFNFDAVDLIIKKILPNSGRTGLVIYDMLTFLKDMQLGVYNNIKNAEDHKQAIHLIEDKIINTICNHTQNIYDFDKFLNGVLENGALKNQDRHINSFVCLTVAKLADNPYYEKLSVDLKSYNHIREVYTMKKWNELVQYLNKEDSTTFLNTESVMSKTEIPSEIRNALQQLIDKNKSNLQKPNWMSEDIFRFWLINDNENLITFLKFGLTLAISSLLEIAEEKYQYDDDYVEDEDELTPAQKLELQKYPPAYTAIDHISVFFIFYELHGPSYISSVGKAGLKEIIDSFNLFGLHQIARGYTQIYDKYDLIDDNYYDFISVFETVMEFNITQQHLDVAEAVRKNYQLFLV